MSAERRDDEVIDEPVCPTCGREFENTPGMRIHHTRVHGESLPNRTCGGCGTAFHDSNNTRVYCDECAPSRESDKDRWTHGNTESECIECEASFLYYPSEKPGRYCPDCVDDPEVSCTPEQDWWGDGETSVACTWCGKDVIIYQNKAKSQDVFFCGRECYAQWLSESLLDGAEPKEAYGPGWSGARRLALERDNHTCQRCGVTKAEIGHNPDVHHIIPFREFDDPVEAHHLQNLVCLCKRCHAKIEMHDASFDGSDYRGQQKK